MTLLDKQLAFIDVEASGLTEDSFPIEIGWAVLGGGSGSLLIKPDSEWSHDAWDEHSELVHGISWAELEGRGVPAQEVARQLNQVLRADTLALTDAFEWDSFWISRLFDVTSQVKQFLLGDYLRSLTMYAAPSGLERARHSSVFEARRHRARDDAEQLRLRWINAFPPQF